MSRKSQAALPATLVSTCLTTCLQAALLCAAPLAAHAAEFQLTYTGSFNTSEALNLASAASATNFTAITPFTIVARFDDSSPSLTPPAFPFLGFHAYVPSSAQITIGSQTFRIETAATNAAAGITVAIFDRTQIFNPGLYGIGFISDVMNDGAGIVGDFGSASTDYTVNALTPTTWTGYNGVGHGSGTCITGNPPACPHNVTPWVLRDASNNAWNLTLGNYEEQFPAGSFLNTAVLAAVPEPASVAMMLGGLLGVGRIVRRRQRLNAA